MPREGSDWKGRIHGRKRTKAIFWPTQAEKRWLWQETALWAEGDLNFFIHGTASMEEFVMHLCRKYVAHQERCSYSRKLHGRSPTDVTRQFPYDLVILSTPIRAKPKLGKLTAGQWGQWVHRGLVIPYILALLFTINSLSAQAGHRNSHENVWLILVSNAERDRMLWAWPAVHDLSLSLYMHFTAVDQKQVPSSRFWYFCIC